MIRATTPKQVYILPEDPSKFQRIIVTYAQNDQIVFEKTEKDMTFRAQKTQGKMRWLIEYYLTQEETLLLSSDLPVQVQMRILDEEGRAYATKIDTIDVLDVLSEEVLT